MHIFSCFFEIYFELSDFEKLFSIVIAKYRSNAIIVCVLQKLRETERGLSTRLASPTVAV